ncbi:DUF927 domain-containing protein [Glaciimonas sp. Gout2]|uniref:DUF927 domain-containing protein n=1 Tax=unclassified Glaciimonas TaxID=2644401 RepID=UPI002B22D819|nr:MULTISPECIES: DUF927 domain-containing protein [unclassified Glaciimonas]MEB0011273.1 DUF927 domain-containing protein [Glaciimonas sp. Cout2]MEB0080923.1 DUF927 domain-containing protein [Glaciimonas sp. Gout2]
MNATIDNAVDQFRNAIEADGLQPDEVIADGLMHRCPGRDEKPSGTSGWYVFKGGDAGTGFFGGAYGDWRSGETQTWCSKSRDSLTPIERIELSNQLSEARAAAEIERIKRTADAAAKCQAIWDSARPATDDNPYCQRKGIKPYGLKEFKDKRTLIIPARDGNGVISTLQFIDADGGKKFKSGGTKAGRYYSFGGVPIDTLLIAEGFATAASLHAVTGHPVAVAFDAGNLEAVAKTLRGKLPLIRIIVCADNDRFKDTENIGLTKATKAAQAVSGALAVPVFQGDDVTHTDFNDLHQAEGNAAVQAIIDHAVAVDAPADAPKADARKEMKRKTGLPYGFTISNTGVYHANEDTGKSIRVCAQMYVKAMIRDRSSENWGRVIEFKDADGVQHQWAIPMEMLSGDGADVRRELSRLGLEIGSGFGARNKLLEYLTESNPKDRARCVQQTGWFNNVFVMPDRTIGDSNEIVLYQSDNKTPCQYVQSGTLDEWRDNVGRLCIGNSRLLFAVSAAFAGMILRLAEQDSGGVHFVGSSSTGKSTAQLVAASVYGSPSFKQSWRATGNALEGTCALHNDAALILDEMAEVEPKEVGSIVYMIGNGTGKGRAGRTGEARQRKTWRLMILSSGEIGLSQHMLDGGKVTKAGQEVRMIDIAADAGIGHGLFEELHGYEGGAKLSDAIKGMTNAYYGTPAIAFLEHLTRDLESFPLELKKAMASFVRAHLPADAGGQAERVCSRFAIIAIAGEYATGAGITGWQQGDGVAAAGLLFKSWLDGRGGGGNLEKNTILSSVKAFFESHGESRFSDTRDTSGRVTSNRAGFRTTVDGGQEYWVLTEAYKRDVCSGFDMKTVNKVLIEAGWLEPDGPTRAAQSKRLPDMGKTRCYVFTSKMWEA